METTFTELAVIKDFPGYRIIMKAVIKHQIQQLVEQLSETTGEQSVLLTASVADGTLSHLGSDLGKNFIDGHDEIMAQFLAFLKSKHIKKAKQPFACAPTELSASNVSEPVSKKRKVVNATPSIRKNVAAIESYSSDPDIAIEPNDHVAESKKCVQEQSESNDVTVMGHGLKEATVNNVVPTHIENKCLKTNHVLRTAAVIGSNKTDINVDKAEEPSDLLQEPSETVAFLMAYNGIRDSTTGKSIKALPVSDLSPVVKIQKLETNVSSPYEKVINNDAVLSEELTANLKIDNVGANLMNTRGSNFNNDSAAANFKNYNMEANFTVDNLTVKTDGFEDAEGFSVEEGTILDDDPDWEPEDKKRKKSLGSSSGSSVTVQSADQVQTAVRAPKSSITKKGVICQYCKKQFQHPCELRKHERIHTGEKHYRCQFCGKCFAMNSAMRAHERTHTGAAAQSPKSSKKGVICRYCKKHFQHPCELKKHERIHTGEKPYKCETCGKCFTMNSTMRVHERIHTGAKPYECRYCDKTFSQMGHVAKHEMSHTGEKPYSCEICGKSFAQKGHMVKHERIHTGEKPYSCEICGKLFARKDSLKIHALREKHR